MSASVFYAKNDYFCSRKFRTQTMPTPMENPAFEPIRQRLLAKRSVRLTVAEDSMWPFLNKGKDAVVLSPLPPEAAFRKGDVVAWVSQDRLRLRRVLRHQGDMLWLKGDALSETEAVPVREIAAWASCLQCANGRRIHSRSLLWKLRSLRSRLLR